MEVAPADHVPTQAELEDLWFVADYKMNYRKMLEYHVGVGADLTIGALEVGMDAARARLKADIDAPDRLRGRLRPMMLASYRMEPPPPAAQLGLEGSLFEGLRDLAIVLSEGPSVLYHVISVPRIR